MNPTNIVLTPNAPASAGVFYPISSEWPNQPLQNLYLWINYPWMFSGGVGRIQLPSDPVQPPIS